MKIIRTWIVIVLGALLLVACGILFRPPKFSPESRQRLEGTENPANGERIYFNAVSASGKQITYRGGPNFGGMMMGSYLTCAACHGPEARGGTHFMHMQVMDAPDISYASLTAEASEHGESDEHADDQSEYTLEDFRQAVIEGVHPSGEALSRDMPRWQMSDEDLVDLFAYLKSLSN